MDDDFWGKLAISKTLSLDKIVDFAYGGCTETFIAAKKRQSKLFDKHRKKNP